MLKKEIRMFGRAFEMRKFKGVYGNYCKLQRLEDCYNRPSVAKMSIFSDWKDFFFANFPIKNHYGYSLEYGVCSYNSNIFTFDAVYRTPTVTLHFHITPAHNYLNVYEIPIDFSDVQRALTNIYD